jgi:hypothetical protein
VLGPVERPFCAPAGRSQRAPCCHCPTSSSGVGTAWGGFLLGLVCTLPGSSPAVPQGPGATPLPACMPTSAPHLQTCAVRPGVPSVRRPPRDSEGDDTPTRRTHRPAGARSAHHAGAQHHPSLQRGVTLPLAGVTRSPRRTGQGPSGAHHAWWARLGEVCGGPLEPPPVLARRRVPPPPRPRPHDAGQGGAMTAPGRP